MFKKLTALFLALLMVTSLVACGGTEDPTEPQGTEPQETEPQMELTIDPISFLELSLNENSLMAFPNEDGSLYVAYVGDVTKKGSVSSDAITAITYALEQSGLIELNGQEEYLEGEAAASAYVTYGEEGYLSANYTGTIPQAYLDGYKVMEDCFKELTADMAEYVPAPTVYGELAESDKLAIDEIVSHLSIDGIEYFGITNIAKDENFAFATGLSSYEGIESAVKLMPGTNTTPYSLVIVTVSEGTSVETVAQEGFYGIMMTTWHKLKEYMPSVLGCAKRCGAVTFPWSQFSGLREETATMLRRVSFEGNTYADSGWSREQIEV